MKHYPNKMHTTGLFNCSALFRSIPWKLSHLLKPLIYCMYRNSKQKTKAAGDFFLADGPFRVDEEYSNPDINQ
jgi:hypothetical protein